MLSIWAHSAAATGIDRPMKKMEKMAVSLAPNPRQPQRVLTYVHEHLEGHLAAPFELEAVAQDGGGDVAETTEEQHTDE
jgi:hypothetical protein